MILDARTLRHTQRRFLDDAEVVVASVAGTEIDGRRRRVVVVTDRRIVVVWVRGGPPLEVALDGAWCRYDATGGVLLLGGGASEVGLRDVDPSAARALAGLLTQRRPRVPGGPTPSLRVVGG